MEDERIISGNPDLEDNFIEDKLRPRTLEDYIGQEKVKEKMRIYISAAKKRGEVLDHVLLYGPPGLGKTTLSCIIANEMGVNIVKTSGPAIDSPLNLSSVLARMQNGDVLFIDEIHRLSASVEEVLYPAMEDFALDIMLGKGPSARAIRIDIPHFTLVGATTRAGMLTSPLRDRFGIIERLEPYNTEELTTIIRRSARIWNVEMDESGAIEIARRSRGTPRVANRLLRRVRDYACERCDGVVTAEAADQGLHMLEVDELGLDNTDRKVLDTIITKFGGGPVGLETIAAATGEESGTIEDVYEPFLIRLGFINRTPRGRVATPAAHRHLGIPMGDDTQRKLF